MIRRRIGRVVPAVITLALVILVSSGVALAAAPGTPFDQVLDKLDAIIEMLTPTPPAPAGPVKLASAPVYVHTATETLCLVANLGTEAVEAYGEVRELDGDLIGGGYAIILPAGTSEGFPAYADGASLTARCEITINQPAAKVRAQIQLIGPGYAANGDMR